MLRPRVIPCLLIRNSGLVKTVNFDTFKYVGDPINTVRIFNEKEVDELMVIDIDASVYGREPNYELIKILAAECRMPLCYGGGVRSTKQIEKIIGLGVEKVAMSSAAILNPGLIADAAKLVGSQSIVVVLDVKKNRWTKSYELRLMNGHKCAPMSVVEFVKYAENQGAGELVINSIDADGTMTGYDMKLIELVHNIVKIPLTALGGARSFEDITQLVRKFGIIGAAAGSYFVFKGPYKAVLITYPTYSERERLLSEFKQTKYMN